MTQNQDERKPDRTIDPMYLTYHMKKAVLQTPEAVDEEDVIFATERLPAAEVESLLQFFATTKRNETLDLVAAVARHDSRTSIRNRALTILAGSADSRERYAALFRETLEGGASDFVAATSIKALGLGGESETFGVFKPYLTHRDARVRANCIEGLSHRHIPGIGPVFRIMIDDPSPRVRAEAAVALWRSGDAVLLDLLNDAEHPAERGSYLRALGRTGRDERVISILWDVFAGNDEMESLAAAESLLLLDPDGVMPRLISHIIYGGARFRAVFRRCLEHDSARTIGELTRHLVELSTAGTAHGRALATTLSLLQEAGAVGDVDVVLALLDSADSRVAATAIEVLASRAAAPGVRAALIRCMRTGALRMRVNAAIALWRTGMVEAVSELRQMLDDDDATVRSGGCWGLGNVGGIVGSGFLESMLTDPDEGVRTMAARFLN